MLLIAVPILSGKEPNETWVTIDPVGDGIVGHSQIITDVGVGANDLDFGTSTQSSELGELFMAVQGAVTNLLRLSMIIRKRPEADEFVKAASKVVMDPTSDIIRVVDKYPDIKGGRSWLSERLGTAITNRRQYLIFRRDHQQKMSEIHHFKMGQDQNTIWSGEKASTYYGTFEGIGFETPTQIAIPISQEGTQTEYADSSKGKDGSSDLVRTPLLPKRSDGTRYHYGEHFECPVCRRVQVVKSKNEWKYVLRFVLNV
jgi:hypothetical protein